MKNLMTVLTAIAILAAPSCIHISASPKCIKGSGNIVTETRTSAMQFNKINISSSIALTIAERTDGDIIVRADDNVMPYITITAKNGTLTASTDKWYNFNDATLEIEIPNNGRIDEIEVSGAASLTAEPLLSAYEFELDASGAGKVIRLNVKADCCSIDASGAAKTTMRIEANKCDIEASGAAEVALEGASRFCDAELSGASHLNAAKFEIENYDIEASGASHADILCTRSLKAAASGASGITYDGTCTAKEISRSGAGNINKR